MDSYTDRAISSASLLRAGIQGLVQDALRGRFKIVLAEATDSLSRDQENIAGLFKRMAFAGVKIVTLSEGDATYLHAGLKGTMNALFLKDPQIVPKNDTRLVGFNEWIISLYACVMTVWVWSNPTEVRPKHHS